MITKQQYVEYLIATPINYTCSTLAAHLEGVRHAVVRDYLARTRHTARQVWEVAQHLINDSPSAFLLLDESVQAKRAARKIELVKRQYRGNEHGVVAGIGVVNLVHRSAAAGAFYPIDYRISAPAPDGNTTHDHFRAMLVAALADTQLEARPVLFDAWSAAAANLKLVHRAGRIFYTCLQANRLVNLDKAEGYLDLCAIDWTPERLAGGIKVRLQKVPVPVRLFKLVATHGAMDWVVTNAPDPTLRAQAVQDAHDGRWQGAELQRGLKPLTDTQRCQCRTARSQRKHLAGCYHAWRALNVHAQRLGKPLDHVRTDLFRDYLRAALANPHVRAV